MTFSNSSVDKNIKVTIINKNRFGSVAPVSGSHKFEKYSRISDTLRHQICKIVERRLASHLTKNLSFLNHATILNS